ncbi:hypothetical protein BGAL_0263g00090 [Botrytis galanthina]|uniref:Uncharacterized protein n=1 Tax=Botrytis galanthina TaxID=278940 RepID=A0A4S8R283_9HELO|nr:hypothetical protein BGAL_0263g00090 [Botrytis galanthina]
MKGGVSQYAISVWLVLLTVQFPHNPKKAYAKALPHGFNLILFHPSSRSTTENAERNLKYDPDPLYNR